MIKKLNWKGFSGGDRNVIIQDVKKIIMECNAAILNFNMFSDIAINLSVEVDESNIPGLYDGLSNIMTITGYLPNDVNVSSAREVLLFLSIDFSKGKGDKRQEIPNIPG